MCSIKLLLKILGLLLILFILLKFLVNLMLNFKKGVKMEMQFTKSSIEVVITNSETSVDSLSKIRLALINQAPKIYVSLGCFNSQTYTSIVSKLYHYLNFYPWVSISPTYIDVERYDEELQEEIVNTLCLTLEYIKVHDNG